MDALMHSIECILKMPKKKKSFVVWTNPKILKYKLSKFEQWQLLRLLLATVRL